MTGWTLLRRLFAGTSIGVIQFRPDISIEWINEAAAEMLGGFRPLEITDRVLFDAVPSMRARKPIYDRVLNGESIDVPNAEISLPGVVRHYDVHYRPIFEAAREVTGFVVIAYEITRQEQAERDLRKSEEMFRTLYDATPDMLLAVDWPSGRIVECNQMLCENLGYGKGEVVGASIFELYHPDCLDQVRQAVDRLEREGSVRRVELQVRKKDGTAVDVELNSSAFRDRQGQVVGSRSVWHDITERKMAERELVRSEQQLRELSNRVLSIQEEERKRVSREFHDDIGQIFTGLRLELAWVRARLDDRSPDLRSKIEAMDTLIGESTQRLRSLAGSLRPDVLDRLGLVPAIESQVERFEAQTGIPCTLTLPQTAAGVGTQGSTVVFRIVQEALTNITRHAGATRVRLDLRRERDNLVVEIGDDGVGIDRRNLIDAKSLGLRGMAERARLVGGQLQVAAVSPRGTQITATIPLERGGA